MILTSTLMELKSKEMLFCSDAEDEDADVADEDEVVDVDG